MYTVQLSKTQVLAHLLILNITFPLLKRRVKCFGSVIISAQVSSLPSRSETKHCKAGKLGFTQLADILSAAPHYLWTLAKTMQQNSMY